MGRVEGIVLKHAENTIETVPYEESKVPQWIATITERVMEDLVNLNKPFKYIVSVVIMEQTGGGINTANSAYWDSVRDGCKIVPWPPDKKKNESITCITSVYGLTICAHPGLSVLSCDMLVCVCPWCMCI